MANRKVEAVRGLSGVELETKVGQLRDELFRLRFKNVMKQAEDPVKIRRVRREIAQILTLLSEQKQKAAAGK